MYTTTNETGEKITFQGKNENWNQTAAYRMATETSLYNYSVVLVEQNGVVIAYAENGWVVESPALVADKVASIPAKLQDNGWYKGGSIVDGLMRAVAVK